MLLSGWFTLDGIIMNHTARKQSLVIRLWYVYLKNIIRLDLCNGLRREVAGKAMPFGQVPEGFLFCPPLWVIGMIVGNKTQLMRRKMK